MPLLKARLWLAFLTTPTLSGGAATLALGLVASGLAVWCGRRSGFLLPSPPPETRATIRILLWAWLSPALLEETLFRVLLVPHPAEAVPVVPLFLWGLTALAAFVAAHPLRTLLRPLPRNRVFTDRRFLVQAALLGAACTGGYLATGSVWPAALVYYFLVVGWLLCFGGWRKVT